MEQAAKILDVSVSNAYKIAQNNPPDIKLEKKKLICRGHEAKSIKELAYKMGVKYAVARNALKGRISVAGIRIKFKPTLLEEYKNNK